jgi:hypothetical protein
MLPPPRAGERWPATCGGVAVATVPVRASLAVVRAAASLAGERGGAAQHFNGAEDVGGGGDVRAAGGAGEQDADDL